MIITKVREGYIHVPIIAKEYIIKRGLYTLTYQGQVIKGGLFGEGVNSNNKTRFAAYRNMGLYITPGNGSYKTMKVLNEKLKVGDIIEVTFIPLPKDIYQDGYWWKVDLYKEEEKLKTQYKNTLWLT
jgi:hypothetical protein